MLELWNDMWKEGNWVPSWPDTLKDVTADQAAWKSGPQCRSIWEEISHVSYWREITIRRIAGAEPSSDEETERLEFAVPAVQDEGAWKAEVARLEQTQQQLATTIQDEGADVTRITYHLIHDAYHLGRITHIRKMQGATPQF